MHIVLLKGFVAPLSYEHPQGNEGPVLGVFQQTSFLSWLSVREFDTGIEANLSE